MGADEPCVKLLFYKCMGCELLYYVEDEGTGHPNRYHLLPITRVYCHCRDRMDLVR